MLLIPFIFAPIFLSPLDGIVQNVSAALPVAEITSVKSDGSNAINGALVTLSQGKSSTVLTFEGH
jgi:hypothetical protein